MTLAPGRLREIDLFAGLSDERLQWLVERGDERVLRAGDFLFREGDEATEFFVFLSGRLESMRRIDGEDMTISSHLPNTFLGAISLVNGEPYGGTTHALAETHVVAWPGAVFHELLRAEPEVERQVMQTFGPVYARFESVRLQREKLAALGGLAAGLAHELNNPAAAAGRAAGELRQAVDTLQGGVARLAARGITPEQLAKVASLGAQARASARDAEDLDALEASDREEAVGTWLDDHGIEDAWDMAPALVSAGIDQSCARDIGAAVGEEAMADALAWAAAGVTADTLLDEVVDATRRVSDLVRAVKEYTYVDRAPEQAVDVVAGLKSTLKMLMHKLKKGHVEVRKEIAPEVPVIEAYGSELNQVWTNLIDNAIDAMDGSGTLTLRACGDGNGWVRVEIEDDGPGIPPEVQTRIFEPFFSTKEVGSGSGLGLDVAYRIIVHRHRGEITVASRPGRTLFTVRLPVSR